MNEELEESPYCEICGHCGEIGCCGIRNFIKEHIEGKTNCKNEGFIINELIDLCDYKDKVFEENHQLKDRIEKAFKYIDYYVRIDDEHYETLKEILKEEENNNLPNSK